MTEIEELQAELDVLRGRVAASEEATMIIADALGTLLEIVGAASREAMGRMIIEVARRRRIKGDGSSVDLDLIERAGERLLKPTAVHIGMGPVH